MNDDPKRPDGPLLLNPAPFERNRKRVMATKRPPQFYPARKCQLCWRVFSRQKHFRGRRALLDFCSAAHYQIHWMLYHPRRLDEAAGDEAAGRWREIWFARAPEDIAAEEAAAKAKWRKSVARATELRDRRRAGKQIKFKKKGGNLAARRRRKGKTRRPPPDCNAAKITGPREPLEEAAQRPSCRLCQALAPGRCRAHT